VSPPGQLHVSHHRVDGEGRSTNQGRYNLEVARSKSAPLMRVSVVVRFFVALTLVAVVALGLLPPTVLLLAAIEGAAAAWTAYALDWPRGASG
jgi:hypothetical protein